MRILHVETINQVGHTYALGLERRGHSSLFFEPSLRGGTAPMPLKLAYMPGRMLHMSRGVALESRAHCDITHIHWASYGVLGLASRVPYVVHCHGLDVHYRAQHPLFRAILTPILRRAAAVLVITPDLLPAARSIRTDTLFVPAAIDTERFAPCPSAPARPWTIFLFARLDPHKGAPTAVTALERFKARHPDARVLLIDYGPLSADYQRRFADRFEFTPKMPPNRIRELIWQADVVVGQFFLGALGLSELQAMSCAKPVIVNYRYPDAYPAPPPILDAQTPEEIEAHLERLYHDRAMAQALGERARRWVLAHHHVDVLAKRLEAIYKAAV